MPQPNANETTLHPPTHTHTPTRIHTHTGRHSLSCHLLIISLVYSDYSVASLPSTLLLMVDTCLAITYSNFPPTHLVTPTCCAQHWGTHVIQLPPADTIRSTLQSICFCIKSAAREFIFLNFLNRNCSSHLRPKQ